MRDDEFCCPWCPYEAPVPSLLLEHLDRCDMQPPEDRL